MSPYLEKTHIDKNVQELHALVDEKLTKIIFDQFLGILANVPYVKIVVDRQDNNKIFFLNDNFYKLHAPFVCDHILKIDKDEFLKNIDQFNELNYHNANRRFYFGTIGKLKKETRDIYVLETQEIDSMDKNLIEDFFAIVKNNIDNNFELYFKPANHAQEESMGSISIKNIPRVLTSEIYATAQFIALNTGETEGRLRLFQSEKEFHEQLSTVEWYDIIVMPRVPDDVPRVSGIINSEFTTPLSHTNILASGWKIPNCIQRDIFEFVRLESLDKQWVKYTVSNSSSKILLEKIEQPKELKKPTWTLQKITLENPDINEDHILSLDQIRMTDGYKFGTKAANIGEMKYLLSQGSNRLLGFYQIKRPPRDNLLLHLANFIGVPVSNELSNHANEFLTQNVKVPNGIAIPFSYQRKFLESSPQIQQSIGKLKMALELNAKEIDALCVSLQQMILKTRLPDFIRNDIDKMIMQELAGVKTFVVRSSSNAEDLENFSAAGIYDSVNNVHSAEQIFEAVKKIWASLVSARSVRLRQQAGISLDDSYMGVVIQEQLETGMGGVMVTSNPMNKNDFRNVYINVSLKSVVNIVQGVELPMQYLYSVVEGGGYTLSLGSAKEDLPKEFLNTLQKMAFAGRLMQSHFSPDYTFSQPVDIEWLANKNGLYFLQIRPYSK